MDIDERLKTLYILQNTHLDKNSLICHQLPTTYSAPVLNTSACKQQYKPISRPDNFLTKNEFVINKNPSLDTKSRFPSSTISSYSLPSNHSLIANNSTFNTKTNNKSV